MTSRFSLVAAAAIAALSVSAVLAKDKPSETFLKKAIEGNYAEVGMGDLAQKNGQSDGVKSFGKMLSTDHAAANQKATECCQGHGVELTDRAECEAEGGLRQDVKTVGSRIR
jgi:putative membrane protein